MCVKIIKMKMRCHVEAGQSTKKLATWACHKLQDFRDHPRKAQ